MPHEYDQQNQQTALPTGSGLATGEAPMSSAWAGAQASASASAQVGSRWDGPLLDTQGAGWGLDVIGGLIDPPGSAELLQQMPRLGKLGLQPGAAGAAQAPWVGPVGMGLNVLGAVDTFVNYDPANTGALGVAERLAVTGMDTWFGSTPIGAIDQALGGHGTGLLTGGTEALFSMASGDYDVMNEAREHILDGNHGRLAQGVGYVGELLGWGAARLLEGAPPDVHQRAPRTPDEQQTYDRLMRGRTSGEVVFFDE